MSKSKQLPTHDISMRILAGLRDRLGSIWDGIPPEEREVLIAVSADAADLQLRALAAPPTREAQLALLREKAHLHAQLTGLTACQALRVADAFREAVRGVVNGAVAIAFAAM